MIEFMEMIFGGVLAIMLVAAGFTFMFSPELGKRILKRTAIVAAGFIFSIVILQSLFCAWKQFPVTFVGVLIVISICAAFIWRRRHRANKATRSAAGRSELPYSHAKRKTDELAIEPMLWKTASKENGPLFAGSLPLA